VARYVIRGGREGYDRLQLLAGALGPATEAVLDSVGVHAGMRCLDLGCGAGHVSFSLAARVGPTGQVVGIDMDEVKLALVRERAAKEGIANLELRAADVTVWDEPDGYDLVFARTLLQHLSDPLDLLRRMWRAVRSGGALVVEDADFAGSFCDPANHGFDLQLRLYREVLRRRGGDPELGRRLHRLFAEAGIPGAVVRITQRADSEGALKRLTLSTLEATREAILAEGLATADEVERALADLGAATDDPRTLIGLPRTFQVWARRS
jgi:ubiquinone/menaquinone biosynthesis C-methylase UbiE